MNMSRLESALRIVLAYHEAGNKRHVRGIDVFQLKSGAICERLSYVKGARP